MTKIYLLAIMLSQLALANGDSNAVLNLSANLPTSVSLEIQTTTGDSQQNTNNSNLPFNGSPQLSSTINLVMQCVGNVSLNAYLKSQNNFYLLSRNNPLIRVPYKILLKSTPQNTFNSGGEINNPSNFNIQCNGSTIIPLNLKSSVLPVDYSSGEYQDYLLLIVTY